MPDRNIADKSVSQRLGRTGKRSYQMLWFSIGVRTAHQIGVAVFLAICLLDGAAMIPPLYSTMALLSGIVLVFTEWLRHRELYREVSGVITITKCLLLGGAMHGFLPATPAILLAFVLASIGAHAPKNVRHRLLY